VAHGILIDTNVFLEVALKQSRVSVCRNFLEEHTGLLCISDFAFHSVGVILLRMGKEGLFEQFLKDVDEGINVLSLPSHSYNDLLRIHQEHKLDFDDSYQLATTEYFNLEFATIDKDFKGIKGKSKITMLS
jgi:predicted nucleic acid-binding protein